SSKIFVNVKFLEAVMLTGRSYISLPMWICRSTKYCCNIMHSFQSFLNIVLRILFLHHEFFSLSYIVLLLLVLEQSAPQIHQDRKSTRLNSSHVSFSYAVFSLNKKRFMIDSVTGG